MKNKLSDLENMMFEMAERILDDDNSDPDSLSIELKKASAISSLGKVVIDSKKLKLEAVCKAMEYNKSADEFLLEGK